MASIVALALCGALVGFAPFNRPVAQAVPRRCRQSADRPSAGLAAGAAGGGPAMWRPPLILPLYYLADATITLLRRLVKGEPFWQAHRTHFYQRATDHGLECRPDRHPRVRDQCWAGRACGVDGGVAERPERRRGARLCGRAGGWLLFAFARGQAVTRILVTGASGFVGRALVGDLATAGHAVRAAMRAACRRVLPRGRGGRGVRPDPPGRVAPAAEKRRDSRPSRRHRPCRPGDRRRGLRPGQPPGDRRTGERGSRAIGIRHLVFVSSIRAQSGRSAAARAAPRPTSRSRPTPMAAPSSPPRTRCAPRAYRSRSCGRC